MQVRTQAPARIGPRLLDWLPIVISFVAMLQAGQMIEHRLQNSHHSPCVLVCCLGLCSFR